MSSKNNEFDNAIWAINNRGIIEENREDVPYTVRSYYQEERNNLYRQYLQEKNNASINQDNLFAITDLLFQTLATLNIICFYLNLENINLFDINSITEKNKILNEFSRDLFAESMNIKTNLIGDLQNHQQILSNEVIKLWRERLKDKSHEEQMNDVIQLITKRVDKTSEYFKADIF